MMMIRKVQHLSTQNHLQFKLIKIVTKADFSKVPLIKIKQNRLGIA